MEAQTHGFGSLRSKTSFHDLRIHSARSPKLRYFFKEVRLRYKEKCEAGSEVIDVNAGFRNGLCDSNRVGHRERDLLNRGRSGLVDVITTEIDWVVARQVPGTVHNEIAHDANRRTDWKNPFLLGDVLLKDVSLYSAGKLSP